MENDKQYRKYPIPDYLLEAGYKEEDLCYVVHGSSVLLRDRRGKILVEYPVEEIIGCENIVIYDTILINVNILTMEVLF